MLLNESCNEGRISGINEDLEDHFTLCLNKIINRFVILTTIKQKQLLQPFKPTDLLQSPKLVLGNYKDSKKMSVTKNNKQELEFYNNNNNNNIP